MFCVIGAVLKPEGFRDHRRALSCGPHKEDQHDDPEVKDQEVVVDAVEEEVEEDAADQMNEVDRCRWC